MDPTRPRLAACFLATAVAIAGAVDTVRAENLVATNRELDADILGWTPHPRQVSSWTAADADGCPASGAFYAEPGELPSSLVAVSNDCVDVSPLAVLHQQVAYRSAIPVRLYLAQFANVDCTAGVIATLPGPHPASADWTTVAAATEIPPSGVRSVRFAVAAADEDGATGVVWATYDRPYLGRAARVFADDFEGAATCRWSFSTGDPG